MLKFQVREDELLTRLKRRARADDTDEVIRHRFNVYRGQMETLIRNYPKELITIDGGAPSMESSHGCDEPYGDNHRSETSREFSHEGDIG